MIRALFLMLVVAPVTTAQGPKQTDYQWSPRVLTVRKAGPEGENIGPRDLSEGVSLTAVLHLPQQFIVGIDPKQCTVESLTDDKNTDLTKSAGRDFGPPHTDAMASSTSGKFVMVVFSARGFPARAAAKVRLKGKIAVMVGKEEKTIRKAEISLMKGVELGIGTLSISNLKVNGKNVFPGTSVVYKGNRPLKKVVFLDPDANDAEIRQSPSDLSFLSRSGVEDFSTSFYFHKPVIDRLTIEATYFQTVEKIMVPIDIEVGLGL